MRRLRLLFALASLACAPFAACGGKAELTTANPNARGTGGAATGNAGGTHGSSTATGGAPTASAASGRVDSASVGGGPVDVDIECDPYGRWALSFVGAGGAGGAPCELNEVELAIEATDLLGHPSVDLKGLSYGPPECPPDLARSPQVSSSATISDDGCDVRIDYEATWCEVEGDELVQLSESRTLSLSAWEDEMHGELEASSADCEQRRNVYLERIDVDDEAIRSCLAQYDACQFYPVACEDGRNEYWLYPGPPDAFADAQWDPPAELVDIALAHHTCASCDYVEAWEIKRGQRWVSVGPAEFCGFVVETNRECGACLSTWLDGC